MIGWGLDSQTIVGKPADEAAAPYEVTTGNGGFDAQLIDPAKFIANPPPLRVIGRFDVPLVLKKLGYTPPADAKALLTAVAQPVDKGVADRSKCA